MDFVIRDLTRYPEMMAVHALQQEIWGLTDPAFGLYPPLMTTAAQNGGVVLGAFDPDTGQMIAFLFGFLGQKAGGPLKLCSQTMGVKAAWRGRGIAEALKQAQRERALGLGLPLITWTFDPLEGPNARLNLHKLRGLSRAYRVDVYGSDFGTLNAGLPSDRLEVEWWLKGRHLTALYSYDIEAAAPVFEVVGQGLERRVTRSHLKLNATAIQLETVADIHPLKQHRLELAMEWRLKLREAFETYFERGYAAIDFISHRDPATGERRNRYLLTRLTPELRAVIGMEKAG
jgi:predicted GNAT superfamily acetyltransferase